MLIPLRDFIVIAKENNTQKQSTGGIFLAPSVEDKIITGQVLSVGSGLIAGDGTTIALEVKVNDRVVFNKTLAVEVKDNDETFFLLREEHVLCLIK